MENIRILVNEKIAKNIDTHTLIADYENDEIIILLETMTEGRKEDNYFLFTVLGKEEKHYVIIDEIEVKNEINGEIYNNDLTNMNIEKELKNIAERSSTVKC